MIVVDLELGRPDGIGNKRESSGTHTVRLACYGAIEQVVGACSLMKRLRRYSFETQSVSSNSQAAKPLVPM